MKRQIPKRLKDAERMVAATQRLEALLRNPGPGITVTPVGRADDEPQAPPQEPTLAATPEHASELAPQYSSTHPSIGGNGRPSAAERLAAVRNRKPVTPAWGDAAPPVPLAPARPNRIASRHPLRRPDDALPPIGCQNDAEAPASPFAQLAASPRLEPSSAVDADAVDDAGLGEDEIDATLADAPETRQLAAPGAPRVATLRDAGWASGTRPIPRKPDAPAATDVPAARPKPAEAARSAPTTANSARGPVDALRASGFSGFLVDWLLPGRSDLKAAIAESSRAFGATGLFSFVINILMLAGPLFMLQVYDRVMTSGSIPTLVALFAITAGLYAVIGVLELVRSRIVVRIGVEVDQRLSERIFRASLRRTLATPGQALPALRELDNLRQFVASQGPITFFDAPWTPVYIVVIFLVHWVLGVAALVGGVLLVALAWMSESRSRGPIVEAGKASARSLELADTGQRNAEAITAMGMLGAYIARWQRANGEAIAWQTLATDRLGGMAALSKAARLLLQSFMLAVGAWLAVKGDISAGSIIAGTIIFGRALAPVEQGIQHWRGFLKARESYFKLDDLLAREPVPPLKTALPAPKGRLAVTALRVAAPDTRQLILSNLAFGVEPGQMLAVIGPSASGKSTLARTLVGLWPAFSGQIDLDGARLDQWDQEALGRHIGYLPQNVELFAGTVRDNISRFRDDATDAEVMEAARMAHAHDMILALPQGYDTELGNFGTYLSAGQRQRIGLSRALFGHPALVVLDEPNANLDRSGDEALASAIDGCRARGQAIVLVSHRVQAIAKADLLLYLDRGMQRAFGPRAEVMRMFQAPPPQGAQRASEAPQQQAVGN